MKKLILMAVTVLSGLAAQAQETVIVNVYRDEPAIIIGGLTPAIIYNEPVIYNGPVFYNTPVVYNAGAIYNNSVDMLTATACMTASSQNIFSYYPSFSACNYYSPNVIRFGAIQARRQGYQFNHRR